MLDKYVNIPLHDIVFVVVDKKNVNSTTILLRNVINFFNVIFFKYFFDQKGSKILLTLIHLNLFLLILQCLYNR